jgi:hypothetical protein
MNSGFKQGYLISLPGWFCLFKVIELALLRSKNPEWLDLYSTPKVLAIIVGVITSFVWLKIFTPKLARRNITSGFQISADKISPYYLYFALCVFFRLLTVGNDLRVGEDLGPQILSTTQWIEGKSAAPNFVVFPETSDLARDKQTWISRPPAAALIALPGMLFGLSLGNAIQCSLMILSIIGGTGWLLLSSYLGFGNWQRICLAALLATSFGITTISLGTASVITAALFPWAIIWAIKISMAILNPTTALRDFGRLSVFYLALGSIAWVKLSSLLTIAGIGTIPIVYIFLKNKSYFRSQKTFALLISMGFFFVPYLLVNFSNQTLSNIKSSGIYSNQDFNSQSELWGDHFTESTQGPMLVLSLAAGPGYALPTKPILHGLRDLAQQSSSMRSFLYKSKVNLPMLIIGLFSLPLSALLFCTLTKFAPFMGTTSKSCYWSLGIIPFTGLAIMSYQFGFNYVLYPAYTTEFSIMFSMLAIKVIGFSTNRTLSFTSTAIFVVCLAFPLASNLEASCRVLFSDTRDQFASTYEKDNSLGNSIFSDAIDITLNDSDSAKDICLFLCAGNQGDFLLRTPMRNLSIHFAGDNLAIHEKFQTSSSLNVYCLVDPKLTNNQEFLQTMRHKFPEGSFAGKIDSLVWKFSLNGQS